MSLHNSFAKEVRLKRLYRYDDRRLFIVPLDHSITDGPLNGGRRLDELITDLAENAVDAVVLHKGSLRRVRPDRFTRLSLVVHLSASTAHAPDPDAKYLVADVEEALRWSADMVSVHVNIGSRTEASQLRDLATVANACDRWNLPLLAMMYARGPGIRNPADPDLIGHAVTVAADLGADLVKTVYVGSVAAMRDVVRSCPLPVIVAGGPRRPEPDAVLDHVRNAVGAGAAGVALGRNIFESAAPAEMAGRVADVVHGAGRRAERRCVVQSDSPSIAHVV